MFIQQNDFRSKIDAEILQQLLKGEPEDTLADAEATAAAIITDALDKHYALETEWQKTGSDRNRRLRQWMLNLMAYFLYEGVPDDGIPERVVKDYDDTRKELAAIEDGKTSVNLPAKINEITGRVKTKFRWGSQPVRTHNI